MNLFERLVSTFERVAIRQRRRDPFDAFPQLSVEALEDRRLMSAGLMAALTGGVLTVSDDAPDSVDANDDVEFRFDDVLRQLSIFNHGIQSDIAGTGGTNVIDLDAMPLSQIQVQFSVGNDVLTTPLFTGVSLEVVGGAGTDTVFLRENAESPGIGGNVVIAAELTELSAGDYRSLAVSLTGDLRSTGDVTWDMTAFSLSGSLDVDDGRLTLDGVNTQNFVLNGLADDGGDPESLALTGWGAVTLNGTIHVDGDLFVSGTSITSNATISADDVELEADSIALNSGSTIDATDDVLIHQLTPTRGITFETGNTLSVLSLTNAELATITADEVHVRSDGTGTMTIAAAIGSPAPFANNLFLEANANFVANAAITLAANKSLRVEAASISLPLAASDFTTSGTGGIMLSAPSVSLGIATASLTSGTGGVTVSADSLNLLGTISAAGAAATLRQFTAGQQINLGAVDSMGVLGITSAEMNRVTAGRIQVGDDATGSIIVSAAINPTGTLLLHLTSAGTVTQTAAGTLTENSLAVSAGGSVGLSTAANNAGMVAIDTTTGNIAFRDSNTLVVSTVNGVAGLRTGAGSVDVVVSAGNLTLDDTLQAQDVSATTGVALSAATTMTLAGSVLSTSADVSLSAPTMVLSGTVATSGNVVLAVNTLDLQNQLSSGVGGSVSIAPITANRAVVLGALNPGSSLNLSDAELDHIITDTLRVGGTTAGAFNISDDVSPDNVGTLSLSARTTVSQTGLGALTVDNLAVSAGGAVGLGVNANSVSNMAITTTTGAVTFREANGLTVAEVDEVAGITGGASGAVSVIVDMGLLTVTDTLAAADVRATGALGTISLTADLMALSGQITSAQSISLSANQLALTGQVTSTLATTLLTATPGRGIDLGGADTLSVLGVNQTELNSISSNGLLIGNSGTGDIVVTAPLNLGAQNLTLTTGSGIAFTSGSLSTTGNATLTTGATGAITADAGGTDLTANNVSLSAGSGGIGTAGSPLRLAATTLTSLTSGNADQFLAELDTVTIAAGGLNAGTGSITFVAGTFVLGGTNRIHDFTTINVGANATFNLSTFNETLLGLGVQSGESSGALVTSSGSGTLTLLTAGGGGITHTVSGSGLIGATIAGRLALGNGTTRMVTVANGDADVDLDISAIVSTTGGLTKTETGALQLSGANTYTGPTAINAGTVLVVGALANTAVSVNDTATLRGTGSIGGAITVNSGGLVAGTLAVNGATTINGGGVVGGNGTFGAAVTVKNGGMLTTTGTLNGALTVESGGILSPNDTATGRITKQTAGNVLLATGSRFVVDITGNVTAGTDYDQLVHAGTGTFTITGANLELGTVVTPVGDAEIVLIDKAGTVRVTGEFSGLAEGADVFLGSKRYTISYVGGTGNDVVLSAVTADTSVALIGGDLVITDIGTATADNLTIRFRESPSLPGVFGYEITDPTRLLSSGIAGVEGNLSNTLFIPDAGVTRIVVNTGNGTDSLTIDFVGGMPVNVVYDGGGPTTGPGDSLTLMGGTFTTIAHTFTNASDGNIVLTDLTTTNITYTGLEPIFDNLDAVHRSFTFSGLADDVVLDYAAGTGLSRIDSQNAESVSFLSPTGSLTLDGGLGNNSLTVNLIDGPIADPLFSFAGFTFDESDTPNQVVALPPGPISGMLTSESDRIIITAFPGDPTGAVSFPDDTSGFESELTLGNLFGGTTTRAINLPAGNVGTEVRSAIELRWDMPVRTLSNQAGNDFVIYESSSNPTGPDAFIVQVFIDDGLGGGQWSRWRYEAADSRAPYGGTGNAGAFATAFDLTDFGVADMPGATISAIRIATMNAADRIDGPGVETTLGSGTFTGQGFVLIDDGGRTSTVFADPGPLASFTFFGNNTFDPDPIYVGALHPLGGVSNVRSDSVVVTGNVVTVTTEGMARPAVVHSQFDALTVDTRGGTDDILVELGTALLPDDITILGGSPADGDRLTIVGDQGLSESLSLASNVVTAVSTAGTTTVAVDQVESLVIDVRSMGLFTPHDDSVTIERSFVLSGVDPELRVIGDGGDFDRLVVNTEGDTAPPPPDEFTAARFLNTAFVFDQNSTPDLLTHLDVGAPIGGNGALIDAKAFGTGSADLIFTAETGGTFDGNLSIGRLSTMSTSPTTTPRFLNLPAGNLGQFDRSIFQLTWSGGRTLANAGGVDFVIYESGSEDVPEAFMVQVHSTTDTDNNGWSQWVYMPAVDFSAMDSAFLTTFDLSDFGLDAGETIDAIRIGNMIAADRMVEMDGTGFVIPEDGGATSAFLPDPGALASFMNYGNATFDPDPIYLGVLHGLQQPLGAGSADTVVVTDRVIDVKGFIPVQYETLNAVRLNTGGNADRIDLTPSASTFITIDAGGPLLPGDPAFPSDPGDRLELNLPAAATLAVSDPDAALLTSSAFQTVTLLGVESYGLNAATRTPGLLDLQLSADSATGTPGQDLLADAFVLSRNGTLTEVSVNATSTDAGIIFRGETDLLHSLTITGSAADDSLLVDFTNDNPIPTLGNPLGGGLFFNAGSGANDRLEVRGAVVESVAHVATGAFDGTIAIDMPLSNSAGVLAPKPTTRIEYTGIDAPLLDDLDAAVRSFRLTAAPDRVELTDNATLSDGHSLLRDASPTATRSFTSIDFRNARRTVTVDLGGGNDALAFFRPDAGYDADTVIHGNAGADDVIIGTNLDGSAGPGSVDFVTFQLTVNGGTGGLAELRENDRLFVDDRADTEGSNFTLTESAIYGAVVGLGTGTNTTGNATPMIDGLISPGEWDDIGNALDTGAQPTATDPLVLRWLFKEAPTSFVTADEPDFDGNPDNDYQGTLFDTTAGPQFRPTGGRFDGSLEFDGLDDVATFTGDDDFAIGEQGTLSLWVFMDDQTRRNVFVQSADSFPGNGMEFEYRNRSNSNGEFFAYLNKTDGTDKTLLLQQGNVGTPVPPAGQWISLQYVWDMSGIGGDPAVKGQIYIDGTEVDYNPSFGPTLANWTDPLDTVGVLFELGQHRTDTTRAFDGQMDDVAFFNVALTLADLAAIRTESVEDAQVTAIGITALDAVENGGNLVAYWNLDDPFGTVLASGDGGTDITLSVGSPAEGAQIVPGGGPIQPGTGEQLNAIEFDGDRDVILTGDPANLADDVEFSKTRGTIAFWINPDGEVVRNTVEAGSSTLLEDLNEQFEVGISWRNDSGSAFSHADMDGRIYFSPFQNVVNDTSNVIVSNTRVPDGEWTHVVISYDIDSADKARIYINGQDDGFLLNNLPELWTMANGTADTRGDLIFGGDASSAGLDRDFAGRMADITLLDTAVTATEARSLFLYGTVEQADLSGTSVKFAWDADNLYGLIEGFPPNMMDDANGPFSQLILDLFDGEGTPYTTAVPLTTPTPSGGYEFSVSLANLPGFEPAKGDALQYRIRLTDADTGTVGFDSATALQNYDQPPVAGTTPGLHRLQFVQTDSLFGAGGRLDYGSLADVDLQLGGEVDEVTILDDPLIEMNALANAGRQLSIHTGDGDDLVTIASVDAGFKPSVSILGGGGSDLIRQQTDLNLGSPDVPIMSAGNLLFQAENILLGHPTLAAGGSLTSFAGTATYDGAVTLLQSVSVDTTGAAMLASGNDITFTGVIQGAAAGAQDLTLTAGTGGNILLEGHLGSAELRDVTVESARDVTVEQTVVANTWTQTSGTGTTTFQDDVTVSAAGGLDVTTGTIVIAGNTPVIAATLGGALPAPIRLDATTGNVSLGATASLLTSGGRIVVTSQLGSAVMADGSLIDAAAGTVVVSARQNVAVSEVRADTMVRIDAALGAITDADTNAGPDVRTTSAFLTAGTGIGSLNALETSTTNVAARTNDGSLRLTNATAGQLNVTTLSFTDGAGTQMLSGLTNNATGANDVEIVHDGNIFVNAPVLSAANFNPGSGQGVVRLSTATAIPDPTPLATAGDVELMGPILSAGAMVDVVATGDVFIRDSVANAGPEILSRAVDVAAGVGSAFGSTTYGIVMDPGTLVASSTGQVVDVIPRFDNFAALQVTALGIAQIDFDFGRDQADPLADERTFPILVVWGDGVVEPFPSDVFAVPGHATYTHFYSANPDAGNPAAPIPVTVTVFNDPNIRFLVAGREVDSNTQTIENTVPGDGLQSAIVYDLAIVVPELDVPKPVVSEGLTNTVAASNQGGTAAEQTAPQDVKVNVASLKLLAYPLGPDGKPIRDAQGNLVPRVFVGDEAASFLANIDALHMELRFGRFRIMAQDGDGPLTTVEVVNLKDGYPDTGLDSMRDRPPTSGGNSSDADGPDGSPTIPPPPPEATLLEGVEGAALPPRPAPDEHQTLLARVGRYFQNLGLM